MHSPAGFRAQHRGFRARRLARPVLLGALVLGGLIATATSPPAVAAGPTSATVTADRAAVRLGRAVTLSGHVPIASGEGWRPLQVQRRVAGRWETLEPAYANGDGSFSTTVRPAFGASSYRVIAPATGSSTAAATSPVVLTGRAAAAPLAPAAGCRAPVPAPVDPDVGPRARCLARRFDVWRAADRVAIGQQLNVSNTAFAQPLTLLGDDQPAVVGLDLAEVTDAHTFGDDPVPGLIAIAREGRVLTTTWHVDNPATGGNSWDRSWTDIADLLDPSTVAARRFWAWWDAELVTLARFQNAGVPIVVRPFHEASGNWFWWGRPDPATYKALWTRLQQRTWDAGVHDVLWSYGASAKTWSGVSDPVTLIPRRIDMAGLDTYDPEWTDPTDRVDLTDYRRLAARTPRMGLTEVGPFGSDGAWNPTIITDTLSAAGLHASVAMLWFDDGDGSDEYGGRKQISSLTGGRAWLATCPHGLCAL